MKSYFIFTRKRFLFLFFVFMCLALICSELYVAGNSTKNAKSNADRLNYLKNTGFKVLCDTPEYKNVIIPESFSDVYKNYNLLQQSAGYDLSLYKGCEVTVYTYSITPPKDFNDECMANIIVYNDRIIGGDISSAALGGFMLPLKVYD